MKFWIPFLLGLAIMAGAVAFGGCAAILKPDPNNCAAHPNAGDCLPPVNDWGDNPSAMTRKPDGGSK